MIENVIRSERGTMYIDTGIVKNEDGDHVVKYCIYGDGIDFEFEGTGPELVTMIDLVARLKSQLCGS